MAQPFFEACENVSIIVNENVQLFARVRDCKAGDVPILVLIHGYPQSSWEYRYATQYIAAGLPLFVPDIPGYGESTKSVPTTEIEAYSKHAIGCDILDGLAKYLGLGDGRGKKQKIILCGHDRGARISQQIAMDVENHPPFDIIGACLADIVPITIQYESFGNPINAASTFHWPFLAAHYPVPETMIEKYGGPQWVDNCLTTWCGTSKKSQTNLLNTDAKAVYMQYFTKKSVIHASCADYRAAAYIDAQLESKYRKEGKKINIPILVLFSEEYLGSRYDVPAVWKEWVSDKVLETRGFGGIGHFCFEEDPESSYHALKEWIDGVLRISL